MVLDCLYLLRLKALHPASVISLYNKSYTKEFYRHDPGEDPTAYPPCYIPHREQSWMPDDPPDPSPKDSWCKHDMPVMESFSEEVPQKSGSASSLELPVVEEIPSEYW
ncbi:hypothetical protein ACJJTC_002270 [Scirpophaga incertulas]